MSELTRLLPALVRTVLRCHLTLATQQDFGAPTWLGARESQRNATRLELYEQDRGPIEHPEDVDRFQRGRAIQAQLNERASCLKKFAPISASAATSRSAGRTSNGSSRRRTRSEPSNRHH